MKKHKFLSIFAIMFALVFALSVCFFAACGNKEDNNDDTTVTIPDDNEGNDGSEEPGGDDDDDDDDDGQTPGTTVLDTRIYAADSGDTFTFDEVTYFDATALTVTSTAGENGDVNYTVEGTASLMTQEQADSFWYGVAAKYDAYICYKIQVKSGETISYTTASDDKSYTNSADADLFDGEYLHMVARISGDDGFGGTLSAKDVTYKITDGETTTNHNVSFDITIPERDLSHVSVNFGSGDATTGYGWIKTTQRTQAKGSETNPEDYFDVDPLDEDNTEANTNDILSLATTYSGMIVRTDKKALATGGTASSAEQGNYFEIDLSDYEGYYVTVTVEFSNTGSNSARSLLLATEVTSDIDEDSVLAYVSSSSEVKVTSDMTPPTLKYAMKIDDCDTLYLTWDNSIYIYTIDIEISKTSDYVEVPSKVEISGENETEEGLTLWIPENYDSSSEQKTATLVAKAINEYNLKYDAYDGAYTWKINESEPSDGEGEVIKFVQDSTTGKITIQAVSTGTATVSVTLENGVTATYDVVVSVPYVSSVVLGGYGLLLSPGDTDSVTATVTMSDGSAYDGGYVWTVGGASGNDLSIVSGNGTNTVEVKWVMGNDEDAVYTLTLTLDDGTYCVVTYDPSQSEQTYEVFYAHDMAA